MKYFNVNLNGTIDNVSTDRLKSDDLFDFYTCKHTRNHSFNAATNQSKNIPHTSSKRINWLRNPNKSFRFKYSNQNSFKSNNLKDNSPTTVTRKGHIARKHQRYQITRFND